MKPTLRCISLWQPWASLVAIGAKTFETRSWSPVKVNDVALGPLGIHASKKKSRAQRDLFYQKPFFGAFQAAGIKSFDDLPFGAIVSMVNLKRIWSTTNLELMEYLRGHPDEEAFGDFGRGRFAWELGIDCQLEKPIPWTGRQGFFFVDKEMVENQILF